MESPLLKIQPPVIKQTRPKMSDRTPRRRVDPELISSTIEPCYKIKLIPNKGQGLVTQRRINALSTIVIEEAPILRIPCTMDQNDDTALMIWLERFLLTMPSEIAQGKRRATLSLLNSHPEKGLLAGILQTNGFQLPAEEEWPACRGLFITISRINHACEPNCAQRWNAEKGKMVIVPVKGIEIGEEITLTYLENTGSMSVEERRESLMNDFGFWCECELCKAEGNNEAITETDSVSEGDGKTEDQAESPEKATVVKEKEITSPGKERPAWRARW